MHAQPPGKRKAALDDALKMMLEHREALVSSPSRYTATPLGVYEENGRVYSSQLSFYHRLLTGQWQKVAVTRSHFMKRSVHRMSFLPQIPTSARRSAVPASYAVWK